MTKRLGRASAADIFWPLVVHYDALCSFYPRSVLLVLQRVFAWPNFSLLPNGFDAPFDGIFHKEEYFIRGRTFATSMDRGNPTLRSYAKKDQDRPERWTIERSILETKIRAKTKRSNVTRSMEARVGSVVTNRPPTKTPISDGTNFLCCQSFDFPLFARQIVDTN